MIDDEISIMVVAVVCVCYCCLLLLLRLAVGLVFRRRSPILGIQHWRIVTTRKVIPPEVPPTPPRLVTLTVESTDQIPNWWGATFLFVAFWYECPAPNLVRKCANLVYIAAEKLTPYLAVAAKNLPLGRCWRNMSVAGVASA